MKRIMKKINILCTIIMGIMLLTACNGSGNPEVTDDKNMNAGKDIPDNAVVSEFEEKGGQAGYTWQEISITLPEGWEDRCVIEENENGFSIFQKASRQERADSGFICGYYRTGELTASEGCGEYLTAYTDDGMLYYLIQPMDVDCAVTEGEIVNEYIGMCGQTAELNYSLQIAASGVHYDAEEYIFPLSSIYLLDNNVVEYYSGNELWIAKNEIYARHGRRFTNEYLQQYFNRCSWYEGTVPAEQFEDSVLSQIEKDNISLLAAAKEEYDRQHPYPKEYAVSETAIEDLTGDGTPNQIRYQVLEQGNGEYQCSITIDGVTYMNELAYMSYPVTDVFYITDIVEDDNLLEIAVMEYGPSDDPMTMFYRYDGTLTFIGEVSGFPFANQNGGMNGFNGFGGITGRVRMDLIETVYLEGYWWYDRQTDWITYLETGWGTYLPTRGHTLYEDLPVHYGMDATSGTTIIPAQEEVFFLGSDQYEWILVRGKDGSRGYMRVAEGEIVELNKPAAQVFSDLYYFD